MPRQQFAGSLLIIAAIFQALRLGRWRGLRVASDPVVLILHVGYAWVPVGLALIGVSILSPDVPVSAGIHALTAGAMATKILAVMSRATLGHTGRELRAGLGTIFMYLLVTVGAVLRVAAAFDSSGETRGMELAGFAWAGAFLMFLLAYGPMLLRARIDDPR